MTGDRTVLHVILTRQRAGTERHVVELCSGLRKRGWDTYIAAYADADPLALREYASVAQLHALRSWRVPMLVPVLTRIARSVGATVIHGHYGNATFAALAAARLSGSRSATTVHLLDQAHHARRTAPLQRAAYRAMVHRLDIVIAISEAVRDRAVLDGLGTRRTIRVVLNGVSDGAPANIGTPRGSHALYVGRLAPEKQVDVAIRAVAATGSSRLRIVGSGPEEDTLRSLARLTMAGRCDFLGYVADPTEEMRGARVLLLPSQAEPFGLVAIEAMAQECPVVGFASGALGEIVADGRTGLLAAPGDLAGFQRSVARLLDQEAEASAMGRAGRDRYLEFFSADAMAAATVAAYGMSAPAVRSNPR